MKDKSQILNNIPDGGDTTRVEEVLKENVQAIPDLTIAKYLQNPDPVKRVQNLNMLKKSFEDSFALLYKGNKSDFTYDLYKKDNVTAMIHVTVPSNTVSMNYDVVIEMTCRDSAGRTPISNCPIKVFSNIPSFAYNYAYVFKMYNWTCNDFENKYPDKTFKAAPSIRNSGFVVGYDKSLYYAFRYLQLSFDMFDNIISHGKPISKFNTTKILSVDAIVNKYKAKKSKEAKERKTDLRKAMTHEFRKDAEKRRKEMLDKGLIKHRVIEPKAKKTARAKKTAKSKIGPKRKK